LKVGLVVRSEITCFLTKNPKSRIQIVENPKSKIPNPKQSPNPNDQNKTSCFGFWNLKLWIFGAFLDLVFGIRNFYL
jgi:hypothetical protein